MGKLASVIVTLIAIAVGWIAWNLPGMFDAHVAGWGFIIGIILSIVVLLPIVIALCLFAIQMWDW